MLKRLTGLILCAVLAACPGRMNEPDAGHDAGQPTDAGPIDAGHDAGIPDAGEPDAGVDAGFDAGVDAGDPDAGDPDAGFDAGEIDAGPSYRCLPRDGGIPDGGLLRVIAANLSSGNLQSYDPGEGARILRGLHPDVVMIQEWNVGNKTDAAHRAWIDSNFGPDFCFEVEASQLPNGVISRWPILNGGSWTDPQVNNRSFVWAQIDVPGDRDLWAISLHLLTTSAANRSLEANALVGFINQSIPAGDLIVIGGDLNTGSRTETAITTLGVVVKTAGPHPVDGNNNQNTNAPRSSPYDWVLAGPELAALQVPVVIGAASFDAGLVFDSRVFNPLSAVAPVLAGDSAATNMQHMAVVKDFLLP